MSRRLRARLNLATPRASSQNDARRDDTAISEYWSAQFPPHILQRGYDYYLSGRVADLHVDDHAWHARVAGRVPYAVTVPFEATGEVATCSCLHFAKAHLCKHIAATCFAVQDARIGVVPVGADRGAVRSSAADVRGLVNRLSVQDLRDVLSGLVVRDTGLRRRIELEYGPANSEAAFANLKADLLGLASECERGFDRYYDGYHDDWDVDYDAGRLVDATMKPLFDGDRLHTCADVVIWLPDFLMPLRWGESEPVAIGAMRACFEWWRRVLEALAGRAGDKGYASDGDGSADSDMGGNGGDGGAVDVAPEFRDDVCRRMLAFLERDWVTVCDMVGDAPVQKVIGLLGELCGNGMTGDQSDAGAFGDRVIMDRLLSIVDDAIERGSGITLHVNGVPVQGYGTRDWVLLRLELMKRWGTSLEERLTSAGDYIRLFDVASMLTDEFLAKGDWRQAIDIFERGSCLVEDPREIGKFTYRLAQLYEEKGDVGRAKELVRNLVLCGDGGAVVARIAGARRVDVSGRAGAGGDGGNSLEDPLHWLKRLTDDETWLRERDALIGAIPYQSYRLRCLASEGMYERMRDEIDGEWRHWSSPGNAFRLAQEYREPLGRFDSDWLVRLYRAYIFDGLERASNRYVYSTKAELLREMCDFEGGMAAAQALADEIRAAYPRRSALKDELARAGF